MLMLLTCAVARKVQDPAARSLRRQRQLCPCRGGFLTLLLSKMFCLWSSPD